MENNRCEVCKIEFQSKRKGTKTCSPKCRVTLSRISSIVTDNVTLSDPLVTLNFSFTTKYSRKPGDVGYDQKQADKCAKICTATQWVDVPISAVPVLEEGWPEMPDYMNGRQYFLWFKNDFKVENDSPVIHNPFPKYDKLEYVQAGEGSRRWGTV